MQKIQLNTYKALVNTESYYITSEVPQKAGLESMGKMPIQGISGPAFHNYYLFCVGFIHPRKSDQDQFLDQLNMLEKMVTGAEVNSAGQFGVLLGMDILSIGIVHGNRHFCFSFWKHSQRKN